MGGTTLMHTLLQWIRTLLIGFAAVFAGAVVSAIPPFPGWFDMVEANQTSWLMVTAGSAVVGFVLVMGGILDLLMAQDRTLSHEGAENIERSVRVASRLVAWRASSYRAWGQATGRAGPEQFTFSEIKQAWRTGAWRRDPRWKRRFVTALGALLLFWGVFGIVFTLGPPPIKAIVGFAFAFGTIMIARGWWRA